MNPLKIKRLTETSRLPTKAHDVDVGYDLYASEDVFVRHGTTVKIKTGIALEVPKGYVAKIEDRSSLASKGLRTGAGVVDPGYLGEIQVVMHNVSNIDEIECTPTKIWDKEDFGYRIKTGDKIAQLLFYKVEAPEIVEVSELGTSTRGETGFGASGR